MVLRHISTMAAPDPIDAFIASRKYPAKAHAQKVAHYLKTHSDPDHPPDLSSAVIFVESSKSWIWPNSDQEAPIRQSRYFYYLTGCEVPDCSIVYDVAKDHSTLFIPPLKDDEVIWSGLPLSSKDALHKYDVDDVKTTSDLNAFLTSSARETFLGIDKLVSEDVDTASFQTKDLTLLKEAIEESRVVKDEYEIALTRKANNVSSAAHVAVMKAAKTAANERELYALFVQESIAKGCTNQAYSPIMAAGTSAATLHYVRNDQPITKDTLNLLVDASGEYHCYASDITRTFPINGKFTKESKDIYSIVLHMQKVCMAQLKPGVVWDDVQALAHKLAVEGLLQLGILQGDADDIVRAQTSAAFFPHGLGHYLGMDTHDTGGHPNYADPEPIYKYLRVRGSLPAGSIITVEPGIYFCRFIIEPYLNSSKHGKFINKEVLDRYWQVGGVRIEDDVLITDGGSESLTTAPKEIDEIERIVSTGA